MGELSLFSLMPLPKSKSQIFTGEIWKSSEYSHKMSLIHRQNIFVSKVRLADMQPLITRYHIKR